ncbi:hypothetical protein SEUCBS140593_010460 [Sporothrix eucalyptigena]|uniref:Retrotransposon gag domain-containing protein n=1 Tax=Sporothrix eucalyptigena TaxID=1812306 RepID=A0ABP0D1E4_9PEZI
MDTTLKRQWDQYVSNLDDDDERKRVEGSWEKFKDWTTTLAPTVRDTSLQAHEAYRRARQRPYQSPTEFLSYLRSLEYQIGYLPEQFRKHIFFLGLHKSVKTLLSAAIDYKAIRFRDLIERAESLHLQMATTKPQTQKIRKRGSREPMGRQRQDNKKRRGAQ